MELVAAVRAGEVDEAVLDDSVRRILRIVFKAQPKTCHGNFDVEAHHALAQQASSEGMVLLKNNGILPLKAQQHVAVIGRAAEHAHFQGGGSSFINPTRVAVPFLELKVRAPDSEFTYAEGYPEDNSFRQDLIDQAVLQAGAADVAVLYIALPKFKESEGYDRTDLDLTQQQVALIRAVSQAQPNVVVVLNNGAPVVMSEWLGGVSAVLEAYMMGQAGGAAIADVLYGRVNPSGKLAETFPMRLADTPALINWPGSAGKVKYGEGLFIGYRYYDARGLEVLFPFGHGLSYTTFAYSNLRLSAVEFKDVDGLRVSLDVTNTGSVAGKEVVQVYVHDHRCTLERPEKELKGFARVALQPGETRTVTIALDFRAFAFYHPEYKQWVAEDGGFDILVGASSADIRLRAGVQLKSTQVLPCILDAESTIKEWLDDPRGRQVVAPVYAQIEAQSRRIIIGADEAPADEINEVMMGLLDMPLISVMMWQQAAFAEHPEDIVSGLLKQVHAM